MAKHVTEEDLATGLSGFGDGFSTITEKRPRRDNPFRGALDEPPAAADREERVVEMHAPSPEPAPVSQSPAPRAEYRQHHAEPPRPAPVRRETPAASRSEGREDYLPPRVPTIEESARRVRVHYSEPEPPQTRAQAPRKADIYTERITLSVSTEMRDEVEALARELQRRRTKKEERITANTVMRVAINALLERFSLDAGDVANNEAELLELAKRKVR